MPTGENAFETGPVSATTPRIVIVTRRFWPLVGGAESQMASLAAEFQRRGCPTTILTARWDNAWPEQMEHHGVRVLRLAHPAVRFVGTWRYMNALTRWLFRHRGEYDLVYVSMLKHDAYAALESDAAGGVPVVLRAEAGGAVGDCAWHGEARFGERIAARCRSAAAIVAPSPLVRQELLDNHFPPPKVHYIPNGVCLPEQVGGSTDQRRAREALAAANERLRLSPGAKLVVFTGRLHPVKNLSMLLNAWQGLIGRVPQAKLWLVGEGPQEKELADQVRLLDLDETVTLTGPFDSIDEVLTAADTAVLPSREEAMSLALLEAMAAAVPIVASDIPGNRNLIEHQVHGQLVGPNDPAAWAAAIERALIETERSHRLARQARERVAAEFSLDRCADRHLELWSELVGRLG